MKSLRLSTLGVFIWLMMAMTLGLLLLMDHTGRQRTEDNTDHWRQVAGNQASKADAFLRLQSALGYGGLIHHVKDILAAPVAQSSLIMQDDIGRANAALRDYREAGVNDREKRAIVEIESALEEFRQRIPDLHILQKAGRSAAEIAAQLPATERKTNQALRVLGDELTTQGRDERRAVWVETLRLREWLWTKIIMLSATFAMSIVLLSWFIGARVLGPLQRTTEALASLGSASADPGAILTEHPDEIAELTTTLGRMNTRITSLQHRLNRAVTAHSGAGVGSALSEGAKIVKQAGLLQRQAREVLDKLGQWREATRASAQSGLDGLAHARQNARQTREAAVKLTGFLASLDDLAKDVQMLALNLTLAAEHKTGDDGGVSQLADEVTRLSQRLEAFSIQFRDLTPGTGGMAGKAESALLDATEALNALQTLAVDMAGTASSLAEFSLEQADLMRHIGEAVSEEAREDAMTVTRPKAPYPLPRVEARLVAPATHEPVSAKSQDEDPGDRPGNEGKMDEGEMDVAPDDKTATDRMGDLEMTTAAEEDPSDTHMAPTPITAVDAAETPAPAEQPEQVETPGPVRKPDQAE